MPIFEGIFSLRSACLLVNKSKFVVLYILIWHINITVEKATVGQLRPTFYVIVGDPEVTANIYCKSCNLPNTDTQNYSTDLR